MDGGTVVAGKVVAVAVAVTVAAAAAVGDAVLCFFF